MREHRTAPNSSTGEINYRWLLADSVATGYDRYTGLEYLPTSVCVGSLGWITEYSYSL